MEENKKIKELIVMIEKAITDLALSILKRIALGVLIVIAIIFSLALSCGGMVAYPF